MKKLTDKEKSLFATGKQSGFFGKSFNSNAFTLGLGFNLISNLISNITTNVAMDAYSNNPNPKYKANNFSWNGNNFRMGPNAYRSSYSVIGGW